MASNAVGDKLTVNFLVTEGAVGNTLTLNINVLEKIGDSSRWYFNEVVKPLYARTLAEPTAHDLQVSAMVALWHTVDWMAEEAGEKLHSMQNAMYELHRSLRYVHAAANVIKHRKAERGTKDLAERDILGIGEGGVLHYEFRDGEFVSGAKLLSFGMQAFRTIPRLKPDADTA